MTDFDAVAGRRRARIVRVPVVLDDQLVEDVEQARRDLTKAQQADRLSNDEPQAPAARARLEVLESRVDEAVQVFAFEALPRREYRLLIEAHPSTDPESPRWDEDTFAPALIAAASHDPKMTAEQARQVWEGWSESQAQTLFAGAWAAQEGEQRVPFGFGGSGRTAG